MTKAFEQIFIARKNEDLKKQILEHLIVSEDTKIIGTCSTIFFDPFNKIVVELPNEDSTGAYNALIRPLLASYDTIEKFLNGDIEASERIKFLE